MTLPREVSTARPATAVSTAAPERWFRQSTTFAEEYALLASDARVLEADIERYSTQPADSFTRLDDFLAELDS